VSLLADDLLQIENIEYFLQVGRMKYKYHPLHPESLAVKLRCLGLLKEALPSSTTLRSWTGLYRETGLRGLSA
jgi:hypothetical protein